MKDKCKDCYFSDNGDCTCSGVKMCVSNRDERRQTMSDVRLIDANKLLEEFESRYRAAIRWKQEAILADNEESKIRADATLAFLVEVKLTIENAPAVDITRKIQSELISEVSHSIARQFLEHNEVVPFWLSIGDIRIKEAENELD